jgi:hypothetical protein
MIGRILAIVGVIVFAVGCFQPVLALPIEDANQPYIFISIFGQWPLGAKLLVALIGAAFIAVLIGIRWMSIPAAIASIALAVTMYWEDTNEQSWLRHWLGRYWEMMPGNPAFEEWSPAALYVVQWGWYAIIAGTALILIGSPFSRRHKSRTAVDR